MVNPHESDWKLFRTMLPIWRERYLADRNLKIAALLAVKGKTETERFWAAEELIKKETKILFQCFDDIRRSRMLDRLWYMRGHGMIHREDLAPFSEELTAQVFFVGMTQTEEPSAQVNQD